MTSSLSLLLLQFAITLPALLFSMTFHEVAHGYVAYRLGDETAMRLKRLSLNPLRHLDPFGSLLLVLTFLISRGTWMFGWAKPVPVNPNNFKSHQRGMMWVGMAGPIANFMLASIAAFIIRWFFPIPTNDLLPMVVLRIFQLNVILMVFNLLPVPPLDGSRIVGAFLTRKAYIKWIQLDQYGMLFIMLLLFVLPSLGLSLFYLIMPVYELFLPAAWF